MGRYVSHSSGLGRYACVRSQLKLHFLDHFVSAFMEWSCGVVILHVLLIGYDHVILTY